MSKIAKIEIVGTFFGILFGTLLHFTYAWSGNNFLIGLFSSINESVWEHTKLIITPVLIYMIFELWQLSEIRKVLKAKAMELIFGVLFIITFFYLYTGALGVEENLTVDIISFIIAVIVGKYISYKIISRNKILGNKVFILSIVVLFIFLLLQIIFTFTRIDIPLFRVHTLEDDNH